MLLGLGRTDRLRDQKDTIHMKFKKGIENRVENIEYFAKKRDPSNGKKIENKVPK